MCFIELFRKAGLNAFVVDRYAACQWMAAFFAPALTMAYFLNDVNHVIARLHFTVRRHANHDAYTVIVGQKYARQPCKRDSCDVNIDSGHEILCR